MGLKGAHAAGIASEVTLVAGDFHDLPFSADYFDMVFCASSIHHTFRPWRVLREGLRVLRPGGVLHLENEPLGRLLCFYGFRTNREEQFTPFQRELSERGSLYTFSSAFPGSRPEILFGMIENERIPLDLLLETLEADGKIEWLSLTPQVSAFDQRVLALPRDRDLEASLAQLLLTEVQAVRASLTEQDRLLGARLPADDEVWRLSYLVAPHLRRLTNLRAPESEREVARIFGAVFRSTIVKRGHGGAASARFSRPLTKENEVFDDLPKLAGIRLGLKEQLIPDLGESDPSALADIYPKEDWQPYVEASGMRTLLNLRSRCRILLPTLEASSMLLLRFHAAAAERPYRVRLLSPEGNEIASVAVAQTEGFLMRELIPVDWTTLFLATVQMDGTPLELPRHIHLSVNRLIPVWPNED